jgi:pyrimidine-nucleoside phosphorylase
MNFLPIIEAKRDGRELSVSQINAVISAYVKGRIPDYQVAAFLMAVYFRGLNAAETTALTLAMRDSGDVLAFPADPRPLADKHSTGGVGDKVSLPLAPLLASLGLRVPMISGRGLGITGGTLDKLDSIPGFQTTLPAQRIVEIVQSVGCVICGQTDQMVPADKGLYALRDVTGTVPSIPLIVASILSKKLAESLDALVLDVKFGEAAFMPTLEKARELAQTMVTLGNQSGVNTRALLTRMDSPVGRSAGNWLEVKEATECLAPGRSASASSELRELVLTCAANLLVQTGEEKSFAAARRQAEKCLASGEPRRRWEQLLVAQGADLEVFHRKLAMDHCATVVLELPSAGAGYVSRCSARIIGEVIRDLGGGRLTKDSAINYEVGLDRIMKPGDKVGEGEILARIHASNAEQAQAALHQLRGAFELSADPPKALSLVSETLPA